MANSYPSKPIRIVVPYSPGGGTDTLVRAIAPKLSESLGQQIIVDNRAGANSIIGTEFVARSPADGYTLLAGTTATASNASLYKKLPFDTLKALAPITPIANTPFFLIVSASLPVRSVKELIELAKSKPQQIKYGSSGIGATPHLAGEMFNSMAGVKMVHVPYKGAADATAALLGGEQIQVLFNGLPGMMQHVQAGKLRVIAVADPKRSTLMPDMPTVAESGIPGFEAASWYAIFGPAGVPAEIQARLSQEIGKAVRAPDIQKNFVAMGAEPMSGSPDQFSAYFRDEVSRWARIVKESGTTVE